MIPDILAERVARAMCEEMGLDPEEWWFTTSAAARKFIAFQRAWEREGE